MTDSVCIITTCKGRLGQLRESLPRMLSQRCSRVVVVDYGCPQGSGEWVRSAHRQDNVSVVRVSTEAWNQCHACNLGAEATDAEWLAFVDADVVLPERFGECVANDLAYGAYYVAVPCPEDGPAWTRTTPAQRELFGLQVCHRDDFAAIGGFDDTIRTWGGKDLDFRYKLGFRGRRERILPIGGFAQLPQSEEQRWEQNPFSDWTLAILINNLYRRCKFDLMNVRGDWLSANECAEIFKGVCLVLHQHMIHGGVRTLSLRVGTSHPCAWAVCERVVTESIGSGPTRVPDATVETLGRFIATHFES